MSETQFPCCLQISIPFPTQRLAQSALKTLSVDEELSPLVRRSFALKRQGGLTDGEQIILETSYEATTNRMLRVAVNGFFESMGVIIQVMEELDVDILHDTGNDDLAGVQGVEQGLTGMTIAGA